MKHGFFWTRLMAVVCALTLVLSMITAAQAASYPYDAASMDDVNLRSRANTNSTILKKIKAGDVVTILGTSGSFYKVKFDGKIGYAMKSFIDGTDSSADAPFDESRSLQAPPSIYTYPYDTVVLQNVKLRKTAEAEGAVIRLVREGSLVEVLDRTSNGFAKVKVEGKTGYVVETHINLADIPAPTPVPTATPKPGSEYYAELSRGSKGSAVSALQSALAELDYMEEKEVDGSFGPATEAALKVYQKRNGLTQNGVASIELQMNLYNGTPKDFRGYRQYVKTVAPVPGALIRENGRGEAVTRLQTRLYELGYYEGELNGMFDADTMAAFKMFEGKHGLVADGEASANDQSILFSAAALQASTVVAPTPEPIPDAPTRTLRRGSSGQDVKNVQNRLTTLGYYAGKISGTYNAGTEEAVKAFQRKNKLTDDGVLGPVTRTVLFGQTPIYAVPTAVPVVTETPAPSVETIPEGVTVIRSGSMGEMVLRLQKRLQELGYYTSRLDGVYLTDDIEAVRAFQSANGLKVDGKAGYETQSCLYSENAIPGNGSSSSTSETAQTLRYGDEGEQVTTLQNRLIALGYLTGSADGKYGRNTKAAVKAFQKANQLADDGVAGSLTLEALYSTSVQDNKVPTSETLRVGTVSNAVRDLQNRLIALGYLKGKADGNFGAQTRLALVSFQKANGLVADGVAGVKTLAKINSVKAETSDGTKTETTIAPAPSVSYGSVNASQVRYANWYNEVRAKVRQFPNATLYDFTTGISWQVNMFSFGAHADAEPITSEDTANMVRAFGGKNTWTPKPVWVVLSDGTVYIATTHDMEHDVEHNLNNNFKGHVCIHFPRTQAQVEKIGPYATSHQKAVELGWQATLNRIN